MIILLIALAVISITATILICLSRKNIELDVNLIVGSIDGVCENFKVGSNVNVAGILGTDFFDKYNYIIDFRKNRIWHNFRSISFKEAMELLRIPYIVLWQGKNKYIFIVDTGSSNSHISTKALGTLDFDLDTSKSFTTVGLCGEDTVSGLINAKFYYR